MTGEADELAELVAQSRKILSEMREASQRSLARLNDQIDSLATLIDDLGRSAPHE